MMIINPYRFAGGPTTLLYDTFTDTDTTALSAHTPDINTTGGSWALLNSSDIQIISNEAKVVGSPGDNVLYLMNVGVTDFTLTATFKLSNQASCYAMFTTRAANSAGSGWRVQCVHNAKCVLFEASTSRATGTTTTFSDGTYYDFKMVLSGTSVKVYINDGLEIDHTIVTTQSYGNYAGLQLSRTAYPAYCDNYKITVP